MVMGSVAIRVRKANADLQCWGHGVLNLLLKSGQCFQRTLAGVCLVLVLQFLVVKQ